jgi:hypothetical protein
LLASKQLLQHSLAATPLLYGGHNQGDVINRVELETKLNQGRNWLLAKYASLSDEQLKRPLTPSQHDPENR